MLNRIRIQGYKSLRDLEVRLQPLSVLFGPNAAGKSNFLDVLQLLSRVVSCHPLKDAFEPPYRGRPLESFSFPEGGLKGLLAKEVVSFSVEVDFTLSKAVIDAVNRQVRKLEQRFEAKWAQEEKENRQAPVQERFLRYRIEIEMVPRSGILRVADEYLAALNSEGEPSNKCEPFLSRDDEGLYLRLEGQVHPTPYLELERYLDHSILSLSHNPPDYPHLVAACQEISRWRCFYFEPRERMRAANPVKEVRYIELMGEGLPAYLNTLKELEPRQFTAVEKALKTILPQIDGIDVDVNDLGEVELRLWEVGIPIPARVLSEGTLRILGMLALAGAKEPPSLVGFEEPENGIHPRRIQLIAELLKTRAGIGNTQYIVTTHSPILPDLVPDESLFITRRTDAGTSIEPFSTWGPLGRKDDIDQALMDQGEDYGEGTLSVSERLLRGDFDG
ncbi:AAA family ATPase [Candidatus Thiosymbion oneisti]|uniref:AAA family ATPase n=1 Tax=Candidatus Thiosymbion oneisti TaxID=589554 RepID=UPI000B16F006|nr:AAA family ATPase [Candidatus Thiosymbion oneisti]